MLDHRIETFLTLCEVMNYREAADRLHITQPAVTQHIHYLEREYGCRLFSYANRRLVKTEAAATLEEYARAMRVHEETVKKKLLNQGIHELKIGATKTIGDYFINEYVQRYLQNKDNALTLIVDNTEHLLHLLEDNQLDFAVIEGYFDKKRFGFCQSVFLLC
jgi:DNA-binding transcriptional LysR family regulator